MTEKFKTTGERHDVDVEQLERRCAQLEIALRIHQMSVWGLTLPTRNLRDAVLVDLQRAEGFGPGGPTVEASLSHLSPEDAERFIAAAQACIDGDTPEFYVEVPSFREGTKVWRAVRGSVLRGVDGTPTSLIGSAIDITSRKLAEDELRLTKERLESAVQLARLSGWEFTMTDGVVRNARNLLASSLVAPGYVAPREGDFVTVMTEAGVHPDDHSSLVDAIQRCVDGLTQDFQIEFRATDTNGNIGWRLARGVVRRDAGGKAIGFRASAIDITARKLAEEKMLLLQELQELALRGSSVMLWEVPLSDLRARSFSPFEPFEGAIATPPDSSSDDDSIAEDHARVRLAMRSLAEGESRDFQVEHRVSDRDGIVHWKLSRGLLLRDANGVPISIVGTSVDITDLKRTQEELLKLNRVAEAANRAKDEFLANVSHEIRTPINAMLGMTELVLESPLTEYQRQLLNTSKSAVDNLLGLINDLLDFSKVEAGKVELERTEFAFREVLGDTLFTLAARAHRKGLELVYRVLPDVPDALIGDAGRLRQIVLNIVGNAIKFTERGEVEVQVTSTDVPDVDDTVELMVSVRDTGIGIPPEKVKKIFHAFEQADSSTTRRYGGTGLGLSIAEHLTNLMHGAIRVESELGRGSTFTFTARFEKQPHATGVVAPPPPLVLRGLRVLVVDDNATNRQILDELLRGWQMEPTMAGDGLAAMGALWDAESANEPYDLVLLDSRMPDTDGLSLAARIRERAGLSTLRIILLASGDRAVDPARSRDLRIDAHLLKPIRQNDLLDAIYRVVTRDGRGRPGGREPRADGGAETAGRQVVGPVTRSAKRRVLVAEDDAFSGEFMDALLRRNGYDVTIASTGREALKFLMTDAPDVMLLDVHMPDLDGFEVIRTLRELERTTGAHLPVIALTARSGKLDRERCLEAGMDEYLSKPVRANDLVALIQRLINSR